MHSLVPMRSRLDLMDSLSLVPQKFQVMWGMSCQCFGITSKGEVVDGAIDWIAFHRALNDVQFSLRKLDMLDIVGYGEGKWLKWSAHTISLLGLYWMV